MSFHLVLYPNPILNNICATVDKIDRNTSNLIIEMKKNIWKYNALGIAAPQMGVQKNIIVCRYKINDDDSVRIYINPRIISHSNVACISVEGCLSIPRLECSVRRYADIDVEYLDENLQEQKIYVEEIESFVIQHEIDHLNGVLMTDKQILT